MPPENQTTDTINTDPANTDKAQADAVAAQIENTGNAGQAQSEGTQNATGDAQSESLGTAASGAIGGPQASTGTYGKGSIGPEKSFRERTPEELDARRQGVALSISSDIHRMEAVFDRYQRMALSIAAQRIDPVVAARINADINAVRTRMSAQKSELIAEFEKVIKA